MQTQRSLDEFKNEPFTDFSVPENREAMQAAIEQVRSELGREYPIVINGEKITLENKFESINPANKSEVVGVFSEADTDAQNLVDKAIEAATNAFKLWKNVSPAERAEYLFKAAAIIRDRKHYFSAWMVFETAKTWAEADGDTAEAIDFLEFYGREMLRWAEPQPVTQIEGEQNRFEYIPLGVGAVIPPWNFPLAIMVGMTTAAIVAGNTVVLKPSSDAPTIAAKFIEVLEEIGSARRSRQFSDRQRGHGRGDGYASEDEIYFVHRLETGRSAHQRTSRQSARRSDLDQARRRRNGRQRRDHRRRRCRSRQRGNRHRPSRVRFSGSKMFGVFASDR